MECLDLAKVIRDYYPTEVRDTSDLGQMFQRVFKIGKLTNMNTDQLIKYFINECYGKKITDIAKTTIT